MAHAVRNTRKRPPAYWETIRDRMAVGECIKVFNGYIKGKHDDSARARLAWDAMSAMMPKLQAIALDVGEVRPETREDISSLLAATGIRPEQAWAAINGTPALEGEHVREKVEPDQSLTEAPTPPDRA
jgi:hypothetical protein